MGPGDAQVGGNLGTGIVVGPGGTGEVDNELGGWDGFVGAGVFGHFGTRFVQKVKNWAAIREAAS